jgi:hypothetical protein
MNQLQKDLETAIRMQEHYETALQNLYLITPMDGADDVIELYEKCFKDWAERVLELEALLKA